MYDWSVYDSNSSVVAVAATSGIVIINTKLPKCLLKFSSNTKSGKVVMK